MQQTIALVLKDYSIPAYSEWLTRTVTSPSNVVLIFLLPENRFTLHDPLAMFYMCIASERDASQKKEKATKTLNEAEKKLKQSLKYSRCVFTKIVIHGDENRKVKSCLYSLGVDLVVLSDDVVARKHNLWFCKGILDVIIESGIPMLRIPANNNLKYK